MTHTNLTTEQARRLDALEGASLAILNVAVLNAAQMLPPEMWAHLTALTDWILAGGTTPSPAPDRQAPSATAPGTPACPGCGQDHELAGVADTVLKEAERDVHRMVKNLRVMGIGDIADDLHALVESDRLRVAVATTVREVRKSIDATNRLLRDLSALDTK